MHTHRIPLGWLNRERVIVLLGVGLALVAYLAERLLPGPGVRDLAVAIVPAVLLHAALRKRKG